MGNVIGTFLGCVEKHLNSELENCWVGLEIDLQRIRRLLGLLRTLIAIPFQFPIEEDETLSRGFLTSLIETHMALFRELPGNRHDALFNALFTEFCSRELVYFPDALRLQMNKEKNWELKQEKEKQPSFFLINEKPVKFHNAESSLY